MPSDRKETTKRPAKYIPGSKVSDLMERPKKTRKQAPKKERARFPGCCTDVLDKILAIMVQNRDGLSVIKLSMVNRWFRAEISGNVGIWHQLYLHWRGPVRPKDTESLTRPAHQNRRLLPTFPRELPNFRHKTPPIS